MPRAHSSSSAQPNLDNQTSPQILPDSNLTTEEQTLLARLPMMAGEESEQGRKANYLSYRSTGFTHKQACRMAEVTTKEVNEWKHSDPVFDHWESRELPRLQREVANDILKFDIMRNVRMLLIQDSELIERVQFDGMDSLSPLEMKRYLEIRKFYTSGELLNMDKLSNPEKHKQDTSIKITLNWGTQLPNAPTLEGEAKEIEDGQYTAITGPTENPQL